MDYPSGLNGITRILRKGEHEGRSHKDMRCDKRSRGWSDTLKMEEEATSQGM